MSEIIYNFLNNRTVLLINSIWGNALAVFLIILFFVKSSRDERGRAIVGKASIVSVVALVLLTTVIAQYIDSVGVEFTIFMALHCIQLLMNAVILIETVIILILKRT